MDTIIYLEPSTGDDAAAINAAFGGADVNVVMLIAGAYAIDTSIVIPSGKHLCGAGRGATIITRRNADQTEPGYNPALIRTVDGATGVRISDLTLVAPKSANKVMGVWLRGAIGAVVERVECFNAGYAFWAQEYASNCVFRDVVSWNANVHFETTQAYDILFENMLSGDGDGDNPLGVEAVWHTLLASRRITFRNGWHRGKGLPFLVVANDINGDPEGGLVTDILFDGCRAVNTDGKIALLVSKFSGIVDRVELRDCDIDSRAGGVLQYVEIGNVFLRGGVWRSTSQENVVVQPGATLRWDEPNLYVAPINAAAFGSFFSGTGRKNVVGGVLEATTSIIRNGDAVQMSSNTRVVRPGTDRIYAPTLGLPVRYIFQTDFVATTGNVNMGGPANGSPTQPHPRVTIVPATNGTYRLIVRGKLKKTDSGQIMRVYIDPAVGPIFTNGYGSTRLQKADGSFQINHPTNGIRYAQVEDATNGAIREFAIDLTFIGGNQLDVMMGMGGVTLLAGCEVFIERLA